MALHLFTGGTGFIGSAIILELLARTDHRVVCVVRPDREGAGPAARLHAALEEAARLYGLESPSGAELRARCSAIAGDLTSPGCGVAPADVPRATTFWHAAASLQYENRHKENIYRTNIDGTRHALELARQAGVEVFNYVSTAYVAGTRNGLILEESVGEVQPNNHYEYSKAAAERQVFAAEGFHTRVLRPGVVIGHSATFATASDTGMYGFLRNLVQFRGLLERTQAGLSERTELKLRAEPDVPLSLSAVDDVARDAVDVELARPAARVFHLTNATPPTVGEVLRLLFQRAGIHPPRFVADRDGFEWLDRKLSERLSFYESYIFGHKDFDRRNTDAVSSRPHRDTRLGSQRLLAFADWYLEQVHGMRAALPVTR